VSCASLFHPLPSPGHSLSHRFLTLCQRSPLPDLSLGSTSRSLTLPLSQSLGRFPLSGLFFSHRCRFYIHRELQPTLLLLADHQSILSITYPLQVQVSNSISLNYQLLNFGLITRSCSLLALGLKVLENGTGLLPVAIAAAD
jgi:hypothetical protein